MVWGHDYAVASLGVRGDMRHGEEVPFMGGRLVDPMRRCLAVCPDMPCGVQMAGWNERREGHTTL